jgi:hypothetical protein
MKRLLTFVLVLFATTAFAGPNGYHGSALHSPQHHYHHHRHGGWGWVGPALVGGAVVYAMTRPPVVVQQPPVVVQQQPADVVYIDGIAYRKQVMLINGYYQEVLVKM